MCQQHFVLLVGWDMHRIHELSCRGISGSMIAPSRVHSTSTVPAVTWERSERELYVCRLSGAGGTPGRGPGGARGAPGRSRRHLRVEYSLATGGLLGRPH